MAKDDMFKIIYIILKELYEHMKEGTRVPFCDISAERFQISAVEDVKGELDKIEEENKEAMTHVDRQMFPDEDK